MRSRAFVISCFALMLTGCSYSYDLLATMIGGRLAFVVAPASDKKPDCINAITVEMDDSRHGNDPPGEEQWFERASYNCENPFPIFYGASLKGGPPESGPQYVTIKAKRLKVGVIYSVKTTSGATGYGGGRFRLVADGTVENLSG
jgi:hypothetical protein